MMDVNASDFQAKARMAASAVSSMSPAEALAKSLTSERPTIDSAIKSFMCLCAARSMSASDPNIITTASGTTASSLKNPSLVIQDAIKAKAAAATATRTHDNDNEVKKCFFTKGNPQHASLFCARALLKSINGFTIPPYKVKKQGQQQETSNNVKDDNDDNDENDNELELEYVVIRIVWNGLVKNGKKPSMCLGRTSLSHIFPLIQESCFSTNNNNDDNNDKDDKEQQQTKGKTNCFPKNVDLQEAETFINEFGHLLIQAEKRKNTAIVSSSEEKSNDDNDNTNTKTSIVKHNDDDSCLLWDVDGGKAELERRRKQRESNSAALKEKEKEENSSNANLNLNTTANTNDTHTDTNDNVNANTKTYDGLTIEEIE